MQPIAGARVVPGCVLLPLYLACATPAAAQSPHQAGHVEATVADVVSIDRIREGLKAPSGTTGTLDSPRQGRPGPAAAPSSLPIYRVEIIGYRTTTLMDSLRETLAEPAPHVRPGYLDGAPGAMLPAAPLAGVSVYVDPLFAVHLIQRWAYRRAVANAKKEVAEELEAILAALGTKQERQTKNETR